MSDRCCFYKSGHVCDAFCGLGPLVQIENLRSIPRGVGFFSLHLQLNIWNFIENNSPLQVFPKVRDETNNFK